VNRHVQAIAGRLSLRTPQTRSLEILSQIADLLPLKKDQDSAKALAAIRAVPFESVSDFERDFPSLCFALATGVGKTRLMGAFIAYLHLAKGIRHFFILAPNLTIYNKLITDFEPNTPKYVFKGLAEFSTNAPEIITGDNYESGRGIRQESRRQLQLDGLEKNIHINIFNISKINSEVRGGNAPRIKRLSEYIGQSYFEYLAALDDLVLLMDESHRYRASAGVRAINELRPVLGLELTATPQIESGNTPIPFKNVIYAYPLSDALKDGFVKEPAVATRDNFKRDNYSDDQLEQLKLSDGILVHENTKAELTAYAKQNDKALVKPFMLIVAKDTDHANTLLAQIKSDEFFGGRYKDKVITVHSNLRGEEADDTVQRLLAVESAAEPTEIVIHVNMLKEGWDVTNLYTIVPLRVANSRTLVEQCIGRGLRLPYGKRVGVSAVDRLTIIAHDHFQAIIDEANNPDSIIRKGIVIGRDIPLTPKEAVVVPPLIIQRLSDGMGHGAEYAPLLFDTSSEREIARVTLEVIQEKYENLPKSSSLQTPAIQEKILKDVTERLLPKQPELGGITQKPDVSRVVKAMTEKYPDLVIDIPKIIVLPRNVSTGKYVDFDLNVAGLPRFEPVAREILIQHLRTNEREHLIGEDGLVHEPRLENYLVAGIMDLNDVDYQVNADLLYKLSGQMVTHLKTYLPDDDTVINVLQYHRQTLCEHIHEQMLSHLKEEDIEYEWKVTRGFTSLKASAVTFTEGNGAVPFRAPVRDLSNIRSMLFTGFKKCLYPAEKFDSNPERQFAILIEDDASVQKWIKPSLDTFPIYYDNEGQYKPDFVVETATEILLCEVKDHAEMKDDIVLAKAKAAVIWCKQAAKHAKSCGAKPWRYLLIPDDAITASAALKALISTYTVN
jgi:type III restriction enzyme